MPSRGKPPARTRRHDANSADARQKHAHTLEKHRIQARARREREPWYTLHALAKSRALRKGIPFTIAAEDVRAAWPADGKCPVLGIELRRGTGGKPIEASPTLDRLNSAWGYEAGNIAVISHKANSAKRALTARELRQIADWMQAQGLE